MGDFHQKYMKRCLQLAQHGIGTTRPNPSVGAVIVVDGKIIGEGYTSVYGGNHAEVNAIESVKDQSLLKKATLYVTLEPCSHTGKTPPCADLIVKKGIPKVVIGCVDSNSLVAGKGIERLKKNACEVHVGILEKECYEHHKRFFSVQNNKRPYIILKWAQTQNGFIAPNIKERNERSPVWISNTFSQQLVHKWRSQEHAILVGTETAIQDNPSLTVRNWFGLQPIRILLDRSLRVPIHYQLFNHEVKTIVITEKDAVSEGNLIFEKIDFSKNLAKSICIILQKHSIQSVIIEGGKQTIDTFINENLWDEARVFVGNVDFKDGVEAPVLKKNSYVVEKEVRLSNDVLKIYRHD